MDDGSAVSLQALSDIEVVTAKEAWSEYHLSDGTVLRIKPIMIDVSRVPETQTAAGDPIYNMKSTLVTDVRPVRSVTR
jgi:hypothetical protein